MISDKGIKFIQKWESCSLKAYQDIAGIWTIGWGTIAIEDIRFHFGAGAERQIYRRAVRPDDILTQAQADRYLMEECTGIDNKLKLLVRIALSQNQKDALISFCYNLGVTAFKNSTLRKVIDRAYNSAVDTAWVKKIEIEWLKWNKIHKDGKLVSVKGLSARRKDEVKLFFS